MENHFVAKHTTLTWKYQDKLIWLHKIHNYPMTAAVILPVALWSKNTRKSQFRNHNNIPRMPMHAAQIRFSHVLLICMYFMLAPGPIWAPWTYRDSHGPPWAAMGPMGSLGPWRAGGSVRHAGGWGGWADRQLSFFLLAQVYLHGKGGGGSGR